jgi:hypothetical protein
MSSPRRGVLAGWPAIALAFALAGCASKISGAPRDGAALPDRPDAAEAAGDGAVPGDGGAAEGAVPDGPAADAPAADAPPPDGAPDGTPPVDTCTLPVPATCFGRTVVFRDWSPTAQGDGTYFAGQAPWRLGFNRTRGSIWVVRFRTEAASYLGHIDAYGDTTPGAAWISDAPCDATFAVAQRLVAWGNTGGGHLSFVVVKDDADATRLDTEPALAAWRTNPRLRGDRCYYVAFENTDSTPPFPVTADYLATSADTCGVDPDYSCYYLAIDFGHLLHDPTSGVTFAGNVIPGLTSP